MTAWKRFAGSAAACSRFAPLWSRSARARNNVCAAIPPTAFDKAKDASPDSAA